MALPTEPGSILETECTGGGIYILTHDEGWLYVSAYYGDTEKVTPDVVHGTVIRTGYPTSE